MNWSPLVDILVNRVGWTLLQFTWQAAVIAGALKVAFISLRNARPESKYFASSISLILLLAAPLATYYLRWCSGNSVVSGRLFPEGTFRYHLSDVTSPASPLVKFLAGLVRFFATLSVPVALLWIAGSLAFLFYHGWCCRAVRRFYRCRDLEGELASSAAAVSRRIGIEQVRFVVTRDLDTPATVGWRRPLVMVPESLLGVDNELLLALLAHELAHIRRRDYAINLLQRIVENLLFFHPAVWWTSAAIRQERENCCDDLAAGIFGSHKYASALYEIERLRSDRTDGVIMAASGGRLLDRIMRMFAQRSSTANSTGSVVASTAALLMVMLFLARAANSDEIWQASREGRPAPATILSVLDADTNSTAFLVPFRAALKSKKATDDQLDALASAFSSGAKYDALLVDALPLMSSLDLNAFERDARWQDGTSAQRIVLTERLWNRAQQMAAERSVQRRAWARAALFLAVEEEMLHPNHLIVSIIKAPKFAKIAMLDERQAGRLRKVILARESQMGEYVDARAKLEASIDEAISGRSSINESRLTDYLRAAAPDFSAISTQRDLAHIIWMMKTADADLAMRWSKTLNDYPSLHGSQWILEPYSTGFLYKVPSTDSTP